MNNAKLTLLTSQTPKVLTKQICLSEGGEVIKVPSAQLVKGDAEVLNISCMNEFASLLEGLAQCQALVYGMPKNSSAKAKVVTKKALESMDDTEGVIARSNDYFHWPDGQGVMMFDYDPDDTVLDRDAVLGLLYDICPAIKDVDHLWWVSSSSCISNVDTGEQISGVTGQRIYIIVNDARDIPRAAKVIEDRLWLAGHGYIKITSSGAMLERVPFDMTVYQPCRLDFASGAACVPPLVQDRGSPIVVSGEHRQLDTQSALPDLTDAELAEVRKKKLGEKGFKHPLAEEKRSEFITQKEDQILRVNTGLVRDDLDILQIIESNDLPPCWVITVWDDSKLVDITVQELLANRYKYHGKLCLDPIEPDYDDCRLVAKMYLDQDKPCIHSFARGERTFRLSKMQYQMQLSGNLHEAVNATVDVLKKQQEAFTYGSVLVKPNAGKLVVLDRVKLKHLVGGLIQYYARGGECDPSNDLADAVLSIGAERKINVVTGIVDHPIIDAKMHSLLKQGYDRRLKLLAQFNPDNFNVVDRKLSDNEVLAHLNRIKAPFTGFDLEDDEAETVLIAAVFSAVVRQVLPTCPAFGFDAPMQGSGKTLLAETISVIASGAKTSALAPGRSDYDEEFRKRLLSLLIKGDKVCLFDNIVGHFDSPSFAALLTSEYYEDRILQRSRTVKILVKTLFLITGNNLRFCCDMTRRALKVRLTPKDDRLAERTYKFDPAEKALTMRSGIVSSVLSLINHWKHCGKQKQTGSMTSFNDWDTLVRQPIAFIGKELPETRLLDVLDISVKQQSDSSDKEALIALLKELGILFGEGVRFKAGEAFKSAKNDVSPLADAVYAFISKEKLQSSQHLGNLLKQFKDRNVDGLVLRATKVSGSLSYWIEITDDAVRQQIEGNARYKMQAHGGSNVRKINSE